MRSELLRRLRGEQTSEKSLACQPGRHMHRIQSSVGVDLFVLADSNEQVFELLNIVDLATRFNICFPVPSKRPDDVLSVLETVWINWAGPMSHLISDMGGEFEGELGQHPKLLGRFGLVERNGEIWKAAARKAIKDVGARGFCGNANHGELGRKRTL